MAYFLTLFGKYENLEKNTGKTSLYLHAGESCRLYNHNISEIPMEDNKENGFLLLINLLSKTDGKIETKPKFDRGKPLLLIRFWAM